MYKKESSGAELFGDFLAALLWICIYSVLLMVVWNWVSEFIGLPKMGFWVAFAIYMIVSKLRKK